MAAAGSVEGEDERICASSCWTRPSSWFWKGQRVQQSGIWAISGSLYWRSYELGPASVIPSVHTKRTVTPGTKSLPQGLCTFRLFMDIVVVAVIAIDLIVNIVPIVNVVPVVIVVAVIFLITPCEQRRPHCHCRRCHLFYHCLWAATVGAVTLAALSSKPYLWPPSRAWPFSSL